MTIRMLSGIGCLITGVVAAGPALAADPTAVPAAGMPAILWAAIVLPYVAGAILVTWLLRRGERERREASREWEGFASSRDSLRMNVLRSLEDRIIVYDRELRMTGKYGRLEKRDFSSSEVRGVSLADALSTLPADEARMHIDAVREALRGEVVQYEWAWDFEGNERGRYHTKVCPVRDEAGKVVGAVSVSRDITALRRSASA